MNKIKPIQGDVEAWRQVHLGRLLGHAVSKFEERVRTLMANDDETPLALSNLALRNKVGAAHIHITRHLSRKGDRITDLAVRAGVSKQAMMDIVDQCEAWGLVVRVADAHDRRAKWVQYTDAGQQWRAAFERAVAQAEVEFNEAVGLEVATVVRLGLEAYGSDVGASA